MGWLGGQIGAPISNAPCTYKCLVNAGPLGSLQDKNHVFGGIWEKVRQQKKHFKAMGPGSNNFLIRQEVWGVQSQTLQNLFSSLMNTYYFLPEPAGWIPTAGVWLGPTQGQVNSICVCFNFKLSTFETWRYFTLIEERFLEKSENFIERGRIWVVAGCPFHTCRHTY